MTRTVAVDASARAGSVDVLGHEESGGHARVITGHGRYTLDLHVGAGTDRRRAGAVSLIPALPFERSEDRVVAGVCGGIAQALGVDATLVRLVFAFLALAGGAGILLYLALWVWTSGPSAGRRRRPRRARR